MHGRTTLVALLAAAAVSAPPARAAAPTAVLFTGRVTVTPTAAAVPGTATFCFYGGTACGNTAVPNGTAAGAILRTDDIGSVAVDGLSGTITYVEGCGAAGFAPTGSGSITLRAHDALTGWTDPVTASYGRAGTVVRLSGAMSGLVSFVPTGVSACGVPAEIVLTGAVGGLG